MKQDMLRSDNKNRKLKIQTTFLSRRGRCLSLLVILMFLSSMGFAIIAVQAVEPVRPGSINCDIHNNTCVQKLSDIEVVLDINPKPVKAMSDLRFKIILTKKQPAGTPYIDLGMPGMKMGPNRISLQPAGEGIYEGTGIIVRCPSGKRIWKATVTVPGMGSVEFVFDVIY